MHPIGGEQVLAGVIGDWLRGAEDRHHRIADELHDRAVLGQNGIAHRDAMFFQLTRQPARVRGFRNRRIAAYVGDQDRGHKPFDVSESLTTPSQPCGVDAWEDAAETVALVLDIDDSLWR